MNSKKFNILIVCTGNTCRSPMAEGILKHLLKSKGIEHIDVSSAGTAGLEGYPPSENAVEATRVWDIDISGHRSRPLNRRLIESAVAGFLPYGNLESLAIRKKQNIFDKGIPESAGGESGGRT